MEALLDMFAIVAPGFEEECRAELQALDAQEIAVERGGVSFRGDRVQLQRANLRLRTASRVLVRVGTFRSRDFPQLFRRCRDLPWGRYVKPATPLEVTVSTRRSRLIHSGRIAATLSDAVDRALGRDGAEGPFRQRIQVRIEDDLCQVSIDSSGELLHRRGYRSESGAAPLRESLAAGILLKLGWQHNEALVDPMCGSGSFLVEAALMVRGTAPGGQREFAFMHWPKFRAGAWQALLSQQSSEHQQPLLRGGDIDSKVMLRAARNAERAGVSGMIEWAEGGLIAMKAPAESGLVICNPPYGARLGEGEGLRQLYRDFGDLLRREFSGWRYGFLCPEPQLAGLTGLAETPLCHLSNGGLQVALYAGRVEGK